MILAIMALLMAAAAGFGAGRIKNAAKLSAASAELKALEAKAAAFGAAIPGDILNAIAAVKAKLKL